MVWQPDWKRTRVRVVQFRKLVSLVGFFKLCENLPPTSSRTSSRFYGFSVLKNNRRCWPNAQDCPQPCNLPGCTLPNQWEKISYFEQFRWKMKPGNLPPGLADQIMTRNWMSTFLLQQFNFQFSNNWRSWSCVVFASMPKLSELKNRKNCCLQGNGSEANTSFVHELSRCWEARYGCCNQMMADLLPAVGVHNAFRFISLGSATLLH